MSNPQAGAHRTQQHADRLAWLTAHPALLARLPGANDDVLPAQSDALNEALRAMQLVQLYAARSEAMKIRWGIRLLVSQLRGERIDRAAW